MELCLADLLDSLAPADPGDRGSRYRVRSIPGAPAHYAGRDVAGFPCILLGGKDGVIRAPIRLAAIEAHFAVPCQIAVEGKERQETLTVVVCTSSDAQAQRYFLHVCDTIIRIVGPNPSFLQVADAVQRLVDLFRQLTKPASRSVIGLVGELYLIYRSKSPDVATRAWRSSHDDRFDFAIDDIRLEVKASGDRVRAHNFSREQCVPPPGTIGVLASLFVESSGGGSSLAELIHNVECRLRGNEDLVLKVQETVAATLGVSLPAALTIRFDEFVARSSLRFYDLSMIPAIRSGVPMEVSQVRFRSDLSGTPPAVFAELLARGLRLRDLLPESA